MSYHNKGLDSFCLTVLIDRDSIHGRVQEKFFQMEIGKVAKGIGSNKHEKVVSIK